MVRAQDFRLTVRRGRRSTSPTSVVYRLERGSDEPMRFGFIASRAIGNAVQRNRWRRRLRAIGREMVDAGAVGADVVVRGLPGCADRDFHELREELQTAMRRTSSVRA
ncbi:ribonuclease P protein component [Homoserinibacter sp. YIM 151385]|uniref:ribonuclease P protein component n=1 Tax=Homoserinibacter sp. YIM 151385 TaxID=2985506 RepID=UPI0022F08BF6|nr:ribonuclease P protein component [Homoserinibacter sp. YIM 151385]WBU37242.1 ribonuclease P protein component [Homoserinibacter sp. YIM 151385]